MFNLEATSDTSDKHPTQRDPIDALRELGLISDPATSKRGRRARKDKGSAEQGGVSAADHTYPVKSKQGQSSLSPHPNLSRRPSLAEARKDVVDLLARA